MAVINQEPFIRVQNLYKRFGEVQAVDGLSFEVEPRQIFGFLGPNGAGKTTTIKMIAGLLAPDSGEIFIQGRSRRNFGHDLKRMLGLCPQEISIWEDLSCREQLEFMARMYDIPHRQARHKAAEIMMSLGLDSKSDSAGRTLSGGLQRRLNIALAMVHEPEILILDEPQAGLDPQSRILVREYIRKIAASTTVILTTHDMDEAERLCKQVAIIDHGRLLVVDSPDALKRRQGDGDIIEISLQNPDDIRIASFLEGLPGHLKMIRFPDGKLGMHTREAVKVLPELLNRLDMIDMRSADTTIRKQTLEDVFIGLTGRSLRE